MGNTLRCCLACVLPCGALDLIRIVHLNGYVEEITRSITAGEILKANPNHILSKPASSQQVAARRILILSPETELKRGSIYFLIPESSLPENKRRKGGVRSHQRSRQRKIICSSTTSSQPDVDGVVSWMMPDGDTASSVRKSYRKEHWRRKSAEAWRPHLDSIFEGC